MVPNPNPKEDAMGVPTPEHVGGQAAVWRAMLALKTLDNGASILLSEVTGKWYVDARIEVSDGAVLTSPCEHRDTPDQAVFAYLARLLDVSHDEVIVAKPTGQRRHYRWNGAAFAEQFDHRLQPDHAARGDAS